MKCLTTPCTPPVAAAHAASAGDAQSKAKSRIKLPIPNSCEMCNHVVRAPVAAVQAASADAAVGQTNSWTRLPRVCMAANCTLSIGVP